VTVRHALARLFALLALAALAAGSTFIVWALVSPTHGPFWSAGPEAGGVLFVRTMAVVILLPLTLVAILGFGIAARLMWRRDS
jgi:hypothetical protein